MTTSKVRPATNNDPPPVEPLLGAAASTIGIALSDPVVKLVARSPVSVPAEAPLIRVAHIMVEESIGCVLVSGPHGPSGIISERDVVAALAEGADARKLRACDVMSPDIAWVSSTDTISDVACRMLEYEVRHLAVKQGGSIIGIVSMRDVLAVYSDEPNHDTAGDTAKNGGTLVTQIDASATPPTVEKI